MTKTLVLYLRQAQFAYVLTECYFELPNLFKIRVK